MPQYKQGDIVLARVPDSGGRSIKWSHPVILLNDEKDIAPGRDLDVVVITSKFRRPLKPGQFLMDWSPGGHKETGLDKECIANCDWKLTIPYSSLTERWGFLGPSKLELIAYELDYRAIKQREQSERQ